MHWSALLSVATLCDTANIYPYLSLFYRGVLLSVSVWRLPRGKSPSVLYLNWTVHVEDRAFSEYTLCRIQYRSLGGSFRPMLPLFSHGKPNDSWREELRIWDKICTCVVGEFQMRDLSNIHCSTTTSLVFLFLQEDHCWLIWATLLSPFQGYIGLFMSLMYFIQSSILSLLGADMAIYLPCPDKQERLATVHGSIEKMLHDPEQTDKWIWVFSCVSQRDQYSRI